MREVKISIGQRFGMLKVIEYADDLVTPKGYVHKRYLCRCECGNEKLFTKRSLTIDKTQSCGCLVGKTFENIEGMQFDRLKAISIHHINEGGCYWNCECKCGNTTIVRASSLLLGDTKSCGCLREETLLHETHGMTNTRLYRIWNGMKDRCRNKNAPEYNNYGGRGIRVCQEWLDDFMNFYNWAMSNGYADDLTIDRKDNNGNYEPSNCRWATQKEQANNTRKNLYVLYYGEKMTIAELADITGRKYGFIRNHFHKGDLSKIIKGVQFPADDEMEV